MRAVHSLLLPLAMLFQSASAPTLPALRQTLVHHLASPNLALTLVSAGALLILLECNLPGAILPGTLGLLLLLSGAFGLSLHALRPAALLLILLSSAVLALAARVPLLAIPGTAGLAFGLAILLPALKPAIAIPAGLTLGPTTSLLGRIAWIAHRNKALLSIPGPHPNRSKE